MDGHRSAIGLDVASMEAFYERSVADEQTASSNLPNLYLMFSSCSNNCAKVGIKVTDRLYSLALYRQSLVIMTKQTSIRHYNLVLPSLIHDSFIPPSTSILLSLTES
jgi:hypothetical protein